MQLCSRFHLTKKNTAESFGLGEGGWAEKTEGKKCEL